MSNLAVSASTVTLKGVWDASGGVFPGSGEALSGYSYIVSVGGTVDGVAFTANDRILAIVDNASTATYASNWHKLDYTDIFQNLVEDTTPQLGGVLDSNSNQIRWSKGADVASAAALPILTDGNYFDVTGAVQITSINTTGKVGTPIKLHFDGAPELVHHATNLFLPAAGGNITAAAGDEAEFVEYASGDFRCTKYTKADGTALVAAGGAFVETSSVVQQSGTPGFDEDFVFGAPQLADVGTSLHDARMWFDKSKGAFRAGKAVSTQWNDGSVGAQSVAFGLNCISSGYYSFAFGTGCTASSTSARAGGNGAIASGIYAFSHSQSGTASGTMSVVWGKQALADKYNQISTAAGQFSAKGDAQESQLVCRRQTTDATPTKLFIDGASLTLDIASGKTYAFEGRVVARQTATAGAGTVGDSAGWTFQGVLKNVSGTTSLVAAVTPTSIDADGATTWVVAVTADDANDALDIEVTGEANKTVRWFCVINLSEVA